MFVLWLWYSEDVDRVVAVEFVMNVDRVVAVEFVMKVWNCGVAVDPECVCVPVAVEIPFSDPLIRGEECNSGVLNV
jgi:hypothetical protein